MIVSVIDDFKRQHVLTGEFKIIHVALIRAEAVLLLFTIWFVTTHVSDQ
jgi:hypothetical protein